jgi:hypothetical protein
MFVTSPAEQKFGDVLPPGKLFQVACQRLDRFFTLVRHPSISRRVLDLRKATSTGLAAMCLGEMARLTREPPPHGDGILRQRHDGEVGRGTRSSDGRQRATTGDVHSLTHLRTPWFPQPEVRIPTSKVSRCSYLKSKAQSLSVHRRVEGGAQNALACRCPGSRVVESDDSRRLRRLPNRSGPDRPAPNAISSHARCPATVVLGLLAGDDGPKGSVF